MERVAAKRPRTLCPATGIVGSSRYSTALPRDPASRSAPTCFPLRGSAIRRVEAYRYRASVQGATVAATAHLPTAFNHPAARLIAPSTFLLTHRADATLAMNAATGGLTR